MKNPHLILFDDTCSFCWNAVTKITSWDKDKLFFYAPRNGDIAKKLFQQYPHLKDLDSLILIEQFSSASRRIWTRGQAVARIFWLIGGWRKLIGSLCYLPFALDIMYNFFARHRHRY